jgi:hypothetical protein
MNKNIILIANNVLDLAGFDRTAEVSDVQRAQVGTILSNMAYFGYAPSKEALAVLKDLSRDGLVDFWRQAEPAFKALTGDDRDMGAVVVYKNFPREVLSMSQAEYWFKQILMYVGAPNEWFTQEEAERPALADNLKLKVLALAGADALTNIYQSLVACKSRWTNDQSDYAQFLVRGMAVSNLDLAAFGFKENGITLMAATLDTDGEITIADATDVLRLAAGLSGADVSLRTSVKFRSFSRSERRLLLSLLDQTKNLLADMGMRPAEWKKLMAKLHPGDFKFKNVIEAYHQLYRGEYTTFSADVEAKLAAKDSSVLKLLQSRPGEFARRLHALYAVFGMEAAQAFAAVVSKLETSQLLKLKGYVTTVNTRLFLIHPPKGNWSKAKFVANEKVPFSDEAIAVLVTAISAELTQRLSAAFPEGIDMALETEYVKLQTNDQELAPYGRGTVFPIPAEMTFLRSASYWKHGVGYNTWFDNGWNFYSEDWAPLGTCCWDNTNFEGAVFSGDPTNSKDLQGRACQMIDLYLDQLAAQGVRYAVWNVLCFSKVPFSDADEVLATLQWGEQAEPGKLYEPSRAQMVFPLKGSNLTKYVAYVDIATRSLVYMDANLPGTVQSAGSNERQLAERMPAFVEYLRSLPSVADLFVHAPQGTTPVLYSDEDRSITDGQKAYVFKPQNPENSFEAVELAKLL